jgi:hypothetical protein
LPSDERSKNQKNHIFSKADFATTGDTNDWLASAARLAPQLAAVAIAAIMLH